MALRGSKQKPQEQDNRLFKLPPELRNYIWTCEYSHEQIAP